MTRIICWFAAAIAAFPALSSARSLMDVEQRAVDSLPDIAMVSFLPGRSPVIFYNPRLCLQAGAALCEFYRYHEYAHIELRHNERDDLSTREKEREADRWAAEHAPFASVMAAYRFFASGGGGTPMHGSGSSRAARILNRYEQVAWSGDLTTVPAPQIPARSFMP
ncbi:MAG: hypothetical protein J5I92_01755 [Thiogranum sp.]|nr:hypothetical protein [Thiogranum sp.]